MKNNPESFAIDPAPDAGSSFAMKAALRDFRTEMRKSPVVHPLREEMLGVLADARVRIDRINARID